MLGAFTDWVLVRCGGRARFAPRAMTTSRASAGETGVVVVCHYPNLGYTTGVDRAWQSFSVVAVGHGSVKCRRASRGVPVFLAMPEGPARVECDSVTPRLGIDFLLARSQVGLVEVVPADALSPHSAEMTLSIFDAEGDRLSQHHGHFGAPDAHDATREP